MNEDQRTGPSASGQRHNAVLTFRDDVAAGLAILRCRFDGDQLPFVPGQYVTLGLAAAGKLVQRAYSIASSARQLESGYELYIRLVPDGALTPRLFALRPGDRVAMRRPKGRFTLQPDDGRTHLFVASGCGIAPFMAMLRTLHDDGARRRVVVVHGVSYERELGYRAILEDWERTGSDPLTYVPTLSRPAAPEHSAWRGRTGRAETIVGPVCEELGLRPEDTVAYICGHPDMIEAAEIALHRRGFAPPQIRTERYWPKTRPQASDG